MYNELRWNPLLGCWIIVSSKRKSRPWRKTACPFCPGTEETGYSWDVLVLPNKFPALTIDAKTSSSGDNLYKLLPGYGYCKVIIETPEHSGDLDSIGFSNVCKYIKTLIEETKKLCSDDKIEYVFIFRNKGKEIGVSLEHPHSQLYAMPFVPPRVSVEIRNSREFFVKNKKCLFCTIIEKEKHRRVGLLYENDGFISFLPFFAMWPFEVHVYSKRHIQRFTDLNEEEVRFLADMLMVLVSMYNSLFDFSLPYMLVFHQAPCKGSYNFYHFHAEFYPVHRSGDKLKYRAGVETGAWVFTYDYLPEDNALLLRNALQKGFNRISSLGYRPMGKICGEV